MRMYPHYMSGGWSGTSSRRALKSSSIRLRLKDARTAQAVRSAVLPETLSYEPSGSQVSLEIEGEILILEIGTVDVSSLRALINSYLRWILCADETIRILAREISSLDHVQH